VSYATAETAVPADANFISALLAQVIDSAKFSETQFEPKVLIPWDFKADS